MKHMAMLKQLCNTTYEPIDSVYKISNTTVYVHRTYLLKRIKQRGGIQKHKRTAREERNVTSLSRAHTLEPQVVS